MILSLETRSLNRCNSVFQDKTVLDILGLMFSDHLPMDALLQEMEHAWNIAFEARKPLPKKIGRATKCEII